MTLPSRRSIRIHEYDYSMPGAYFITIVTRTFQCVLSQVADGSVLLYDLGNITRREWERLPSRFDNLQLGEFVIMPNHMHGILILTDPRRGTGVNAIQHNLTPNPRAPTVEQFGKPVPGSIPTIIRSYKAAVTYRYRLMCGQNAPPLWQRNYYEHIIRDEHDWEVHRQYIIQNPANWKSDKLHPGA